MGNPENKLTDTVAVGGEIKSGSRDVEFCKLIDQYVDGILNSLLSEQNIDNDSQENFAKFRAELKNIVKQKIEEYRLMLVCLEKADSYLEEIPSKINAINDEKELLTAEGHNVNELYKSTKRKLEETSNSFFHGKVKLSEDVKSLGKDIDDQKTEIDVVEKFGVVDEFNPQ